MIPTLRLSSPIQRPLGSEGAEGAATQSRVAKSNCWQGSTSSGLAGKFATAFSSISLSVSITSSIARAFSALWACPSFKFFSNPVPNLLNSFKT